MPHAWLPAPLAPDALVALASPATCLEEATAQKAKIDTARTTLSAALDTVQSAIQHNHADSLAGRKCWTYDQRIAADDLVRVMKRQRQQFQELAGTATRALKTYQATREVPQQGPAPRAVRFMVAAERLLAPETYQLILDSAAGQGEEEPPHGLR